MGGCLYRNKQSQYNYTIEDITLRQQLTRSRVEQLTKLLEEKQLREERYQKNIEEGEKQRQPKKLNQSSIEQSGFDISLSKNNQVMQNIEEAEEESSREEKNKFHTERRLPDDEPMFEDGDILVQLASTDQLVKTTDNIRDQLQGRQSNEMDDVILQYFNKTKQDYSN